MKRIVSFILMCIFMLSMVLMFNTETVFAATISGDASVDFDSVNKIWTIETNLVRQKLQFTTANKFLLTSLYNKATSMEYKDASLVSGEFRVTVDGVEYTGDSGGYTYDSYTATVLPAPSASPAAPSAIELKIVFHNTKIQVTAIYTIYPSTPRNNLSIIKRVFQFKNIYGSNIVLSNIYISDFQVMDSQVNNLQLNYFWGGAMGPGVNELHTEAMNSTYYKYFDSMEGHPDVTIGDKYEGSGTYHPIFILHNSSLNEGMFSAFNYLGPWQADIGYQNSATVNVKVKFTHQETISSNTVFETPNSLTGIYSGDLDSMTNQLLDWQYVYKWDYTRTGYCPTSGMWNNLWWVESHRYDVSGHYNDMVNIVELCRRYGLDVAHEDYGWWQSGSIGDWSGPDWRQIKDYASKSGEIFKLWMPPYIYELGTKAITDNPGWALSPAQPADITFYGSRIYCIAQDNVLDYMENLLENKQIEYGSYFERLDACAMAPCSSTTHNHPANYPFLNQYRNYIKMLKDAKDADPNMGIEGCNNGGQFLNWDKMEYVDDQQPSDGGGPDDIFYCTYLYPFIKIAGAALGGYPSDAAVTDLENARKRVSFYKYLASQGVIARYSKTYHPASTGTGDTHTFLEYLTGDASKGVIIVDKSTTGTVYPKGLNPTSNYTVTFRKNTDSATNTGSYWMTNGITLATAQTYEFILLNLPDAPQRGTDTASPSAPANVTKKENYNVGYTGVEISWTASSDNVWMGWYEIYRDGVLIDKVAKGTYYFDRSAGNSVTRNYQVKSVDDDNNVSSPVGANLSTSDTSQASSGFTSAQGQNNWSYQYWNGSSYTNMTWDVENNRWSQSGTYCIIGTGFLHPDANDAALVWTAPQSGMAFINGNAAKNVTGGDGVNIKIMKNGSQVWPASGWQFIAQDDQTGVATNINIPVTSGDKIYFIVNKNGEITCDGTCWDPHITLEQYTSKPFYLASDWFSSTQGSGKWTYQYWNGSIYTDMTWDSANSRWSQAGTYCIVANNAQHPDANDSVRTFTAPLSGTIWITGNVAKGDTTGGDGVRVKIMKNGTQLWPASGWQTIAYNDSVGYNININTSVSVNDKIYFFVNKNDNITCDGTSWNPRISYSDPAVTPDSYRASDGFSPSLGYDWKYGFVFCDTFKSSAGFASTQGADNWYYKYWDGSTYTDMTWDAENNRWSQPGTLCIVGNGMQHTDTNDSVRTFSVPRSGTISITGLVAKNAIGGDGVDVKIMKNSTQIWPTSGWQFIAQDNTAGIDVNINTTVNAGDNIYFIVNKVSTNSFDGTSWDPVITYISTSVSNLTWDSTNGYWSVPSTSCIVGAGSQHPGYECSVREFVVPRSGSITISGRVSKECTNGDGVLVKILKNNTSQVWPFSGWWYINSWDIYGTSINTTLNVVAGDRIQFILNRYGDSGYGSTIWDPVITYN